MLFCQITRFTFQYVSIISSRRDRSGLGKILIYIPICFYYFCFVYLYHNSLQLFTFQYVSIISIKESKVNKYIYNLHSNMFLLFLDFFCYKRYGDKIYIPICFYYFPSNVALYNSTTILPSFVDPVIIFCFFKKIFSFFPKLCIFPTKRQLSTPRLFYLITGRQFSFYMNSPSISNSSCIISPMPFPVSNSNSYLYVALWISITFRFLPLPIVFLSTFSGNF